MEYKKNIYIYSAVLTLTIESNYNTMFHRYIVMFSLAHTHTLTRSIVAVRLVIFGFNFSSPILYGDAHTIICFTFTHVHVLLYCICIKYIMYTLITLAAHNTFLPFNIVVAD